MKIIVAVDRKWGIGRDNGLLFSVPEDMKFFRTTTTGKVIIVGRKTLESFPGGQPLKNRTNVVLSRGPVRDGVTVVDGLPALMRVLGDFNDDDVYVCGGASVYRMLLPYCSEALVTKIDADGEADTFFPNLDEEYGWRVGEILSEAESNGYRIKFCRYINEDIKSFTSGE